MARLISDELWATATIYAEARGEPQTGRVGVAEVLRRRTEQRYQSDGTVPGTVLYPMAFSCWNSSDPNRIACAKLDTDDPIVAQCLEAWREAMHGSNVSNGALHYYNPRDLRVTPGWIRRCRETARLGHHIFLLPLDR